MRVRFLLFLLPSLALFLGGIIYSIFIGYDDTAFILAMIILFTIICFFGDLCGGSKIYSAIFSFFILLVIQYLAVILPLWFGDKPFYRFFSDYNEATEYFIKFGVISCLGFVFLSISYSLARGRSEPFSLCMCEGEYKFNFFGILSPLFISVCGFIYIIYNVGGLYFLLGNIGYRNQVLSSFTALLAFIKLGYLTSSLFLIIGKNKLSLFSFLLQSFILGSLGERGAVLFVGVIPILVIYSLLKGGLSRKFIFLSVSSFLLFYVIIGSIRSTQVDELSNESISIDTLLSVVSKTEHQINASATIKLADENGYEFGSNLGYFFLAIIPRSVWAEKPVTSESAIIGMKIKNVDDPSGAGLPPGVFAYGYYHFGWIGVVIFSIIAGGFSGYMERYFLTPYTENKLFIYVQLQVYFVYIFSTEVQVKMLVAMVITLVVLRLSAIKIIK